MFGRGVKLEVAMKDWRRIRSRSRPALELLQNKCNGSSIVHMDTCWNFSSDYEVELQVVANPTASRSALPQGALDRARASSSGFLVKMRGMAFVQCRDRLDGISRSGTRRTAARDTLRVEWRGVKEMKSDGRASAAEGASLAYTASFALAQVGG